jgi:ADP-ribosylglycohydrolase
LDWTAALRRATSGREERTIAALLGRSDETLQNGGFAPEVLRAALFFVSKHTGFDAALEAAVAFAGPENYCPVLVGAIAGARWGAAAIPSVLLSHCEILAEVEKSAEELGNLWWGSWTRVQ